MSSSLAVTKSKTTTTVGTGAPYRGYRRNISDCDRRMNNHVLSYMEKGVVPWRIPWSRTGGLPHKLIAGTPYRGVNTMVLALSQVGRSSSYWLTANQARAHGGKIKAGESPVMIVCREPIPPKVSGADAEGAKASMIEFGRIAIAEKLGPRNIQSVVNGLKELKAILEKKGTPLEDEDASELENMISGLTDQEILKSVPAEALLTGVATQLQASQVKYLKETGDALMSVITMATGPTKVHPTFVVHTFYVYNVEQTEGVKHQALSSGPPVYPKMTLDKVLDKMKNKPTISRVQPTAFYNIKTDTVNVPDSSTFSTPEKELATIFHELAHAAGAPSRLDHYDEKMPVDQMRSSSFSLEELTAEITAALLCAAFGIDPEPIPGIQLKPYLDGWMSKLRADEMMFMVASQRAGRRVDYILGEDNLLTAAPDEKVN